MSDLRTRIAKALFDHAAAEYSWGVDGCQCGADTQDKQAQHQADAVIREVSAFHREVSEDDFLDALLGEDDETH